MKLPGKIAMPDPARGRPCTFLQGRYQVSEGESKD